MLNDNDRDVLATSIGKYFRWHFCSLFLTGIGLMPGLFFPLVVLGDDWPMWRYNAGRSGASGEQLASELHLQWVRELPSPKPAWPASQDRLQFDASYEPVVAGKTIFIGSMVSDSVTAYDTDTGAEKWCFYCDGPVRFAPVVYKNRLYFVSDDGYLYAFGSPSTQPTPSNAITLGDSSPTSSPNPELASSPVSFLAESPESSSTPPATVTPEQVTVSTNAAPMTLLGIVLGIMIVAAPIVVVIIVGLLFYFKKRNR